jgi:hypothetical protein
MGPGKRNHKANDGVLHPFFILLPPKSIGIVGYQKVDIKKAWKVFTGVIYTNCITSRNATVNKAGIYL